ncbi:hypothetical protein I79_021061 [Cricetulus griseus]|uniref:Uncharacterized protein n=1 Tax=Cricetulus griseus TaxID=10029 RepID=G3IBN0_CRIGR|nr:hypothetical protein I79_021061 [Cricetulus griseus]
MKTTVLCKVESTGGPNLRSHLYPRGWKTLGNPLLACDLLSSEGKVKAISYR